MLFNMSHKDKTKDILSVNVNFDAPKIRFAL
jgi:hypothetical protein